MRIYLTGPITGHTFQQIENWRATAARLLKPVAEIIDPANYTYDSRVAFRKRERTSDELARIQHGVFVLERNRKLIRDSDAVLANFVGAGDRASIGAIGELFWADAFDKPIVIIREEHGNVHDHAMLNAVASIVCHSLDEGIAVVRELAGELPNRKRTKRG